MAQPQELAPIYYDLDTWEGQPEIKQALKAVADRKRRRDAIQAGR